jgi:outer membrane protein OmpA-like peptidoglycan-associated protein
MKVNVFTLFIAAGALLASCAEVKEDNVEDVAELREIAAEDTAVMYDESALMAGVTEAEMLKFKDVNFNAPILEEPALKAAKVEVRGTKTYRIYSIGDDIMFDLNKATLRPDGEEKLNAIVKSIKENSPNGLIRVYGFTDSLASESYNKKLAMDRAKSVQDWLINNSDLNADQMKLVPVGEHMFEATNKTAKGRQQNRRVEIVVIEE